MALKIYDTFAPQGEYPAVKAEDVEMPDGSRLSDFEGGFSIVVDDALSETSTNPVQNKVITTQMNTAIGILQTQVLPKLLPSVTTSDNGKVLSVTDGVWVVKEITGGSGGSITVDSALSPDSTNPVQNKVIYAQLVQANTVLQQLQASIPTDAHINGLIDTYLSEALGGDY